MDTRGDEDDVLFTVKVKELPQAIANVGSLHLSGQRGLACVSSYCSKGDSGMVRICHLFLCYSVLIILNTLLCK